MGVGEHRGYKLPPSYGVHRSRPLLLSILLSSPKLETQRGRQGVFQGSEIFKVDPPGTATNITKYPIIPVIFQCPPRSNPRLGQPRIVQRVQLAWVESAGTFLKDPQSPSTLDYKLQLTRTLWGAAKIGEMSLHLVPVLEGLAWVFLLILSEGLGLNEL